MKIIFQSDKYQYNITDYVSKVEWSGSVSQASRALEISVLYSPLDKNIRDFNIKNGDRILFYESGYLLCNAMVYKRERVGTQGEVTYICYDDLKHLVKSTMYYNFSNTTPEKITETVCKDIGVRVGNIVTTGINIPKLIIQGDNGYQIIMKAYTKAYAENGKKYMPIMVNQKLSVIEKGEVVSGYRLSDQTNITDSTYEQSIEDMVNVVNIYDEDGLQVGQVVNKTNVEKYGIFASAYQEEEDLNAETVALSLLQGEKDTATIDALGNIKCIAGYGIRIDDSITGLVGKFWIDSDTHTWENGIHKMTLNVTFQNLMDEQEDMSIDE